MSRRRLVVVGDLLLDRDLIGTAERLAPDAPVPVIEVTEEHVRPGGAGLAAVLAAGDGHDVTLVTAMADDPAAQQLRSLLAGRVRLITLHRTGTTEEKIRIRVGDSSIARLDRGGSGGIDDSPGADTDRSLHDCLSGADSVLVSDYGRGLTGLPLVRRAVEGAVARIPVVWDPHPRGAAPVPGAQLVTPNAAEARVFHAALPGGQREDTLGAAASRAGALVQAWRAGAVAVTIGSRGAVLSYGEGPPFVAPAPPVRGGDPCGAGDRFASTAAARLADGDLPSEAVLAAVQAASAFVGAGGVASLRERGPGAGHAGPPSGSTALDVVRRTRRAGGTVVATGGCFDLLHAGHVATLRAARQLGDCLVVCLNSDESVRRLKGPGRPVVPQADRIRVLEALEFVDAVIPFDADTPEGVLQQLRPDVWAKGGDYALTELPEAQIMRTWGGQVVVLPYLEGRSTTRLVQASGDVRDLPDVRDPRAKRDQPTERSTV